MKTRMVKIGVATMIGWLALVAIGPCAPLAKRAHGQMRMPPCIGAQRALEEAQAVIDTQQDAFFIMLGGYVVLGLVIVWMRSAWRETVRKRVELLHRSIKMSEALRKIQTADRVALVWDYGQGHGWTAIHRDDLESCATGEQIAEMILATAIGHESVNNAIKPNGTYNGGGVTHG